MREVRGSNPVIGKNLYWILNVNCVEKMKNKEKEAGNGPFQKNSSNGLRFVKASHMICNIQQPIIAVYTTVEHIIRLWNLNTTLSHGPGPSDWLKNLNQPKRIILKWL